MDKWEALKRELEGMRDMAHKVANDISTSDAYSLESGYKGEAYDEVLDLMERMEKGHG